MKGVRRSITMAGLAATIATGGAAQAEKPKRTVLYEVKPADTLYDLGGRYLNRRRDYLIVQRLNHVGNPYRLMPKRKLTVPVAILKTVSVQAHLLSFRGAVRIGENGATPAAGMAIDEGTLLRTGAGAFLTIAVADGSRISMPSNSVMRLSRMRRVLLTGSVDQEFAVERGHVETRVEPQRHPDSSYRIRTPIAVSAVRGTEFRVAYADGPSLTEVLSGYVAVGRPGTAAISVAPGMGAAVSANGLVTTESLLPAPEPIDPGKVQSAHDVTLALTPVAGAARYHVQLARDAGFIDIFADTETMTPEVGFPGVPDGDHFARATALSATGFEGLPKVYAVTRRLNAIDGTAARIGPRNYRFAWRAEGAGRAQYRFQLLPAKDGAPLVDMPGLDLMAIELNDLPTGTYRWRIGAIRRAANGALDEAWTEPAAIDIAAPKGR